VTPASTPGGLRFRLRQRRPLLAVELRPPRRDLAGDRALDAWIDVYQAVRRLSRADTVIFLTDDAVGTGEEESVTHLVRNLGPDARRERIVPFLTLKHPLAYCLRFAHRAAEEGFPGLVVLGGDAAVGPPRCLPRSWQLREKLRAARPGLLLGGWVNPFRDPAEMVSLLLDHGDGLDFLLTHVVSHHAPAPLERFLGEADRRGLDLPLFAGVFFWRSARRGTLDALARFLPVPREGLAREFGREGLGPAEVAARTLRWLAGLGLTRFYVSNLPTARAASLLAEIADRAGVPPPEGLARLATGAGGSHGRDPGCPGGAPRGG